MLCPPQEEHRAALRQFMRDEYGIEGHALEFVPLGEDSWSFHIGGFWASIRRDLRGHRPEAYEASYELFHAGLDFVLAPTAGVSGRLVHRVNGWPVVVFPYRQVSQLDENPVATDDISVVTDMLERLHQSHVTTALPREEFTLPFVDDVKSAVAAADMPLKILGPYSEPLHSLLREYRNRLETWLAEFDHLAKICRTMDDAFVLTHGEPLPSNVLRQDERFLLADWGELMWGPPERDWSHVLRTLGFAPPGRSDVMRLYQLRWILSEIAEYTSVFLAPHDETGDPAAMWSRLLRYAPDFKMRGRA